MAHSLDNHTNAAYLKNAPIVERAIVKIVKEVISKKFVWPHVMKFKLLWPKAWQPEYRGEKDCPESWGKSKEEWEAEKKIEREREIRIAKERESEKEKEKEKEVSSRVAVQSSKSFKSSFNTVQPHVG